IGGNDIEVYSSDGDDFICVLFRKLEGVNFTEDQTLLTSDRMEQWGALVGRIHRLSSELSGQIPRQHWHEDMLVAQRTDVLKDYPTILSRVNKVVSQISTLEKTQSSYGLIHQDLHEANLIIHQDTMTIIDFDDCIYHYYLYDIAAILFHYAWRFGGADRRDEVIAEFFPHFIAGYRTEFSYDDSQRDLLLRFVKHRHHCLFSTLAYELAIEEDDWSRKIHDGWKHCLEDDMDWISPEVLKLG
ncbi:MAG: phosphotransferase enzyme family protein, partial [Candidatus Kariarchaeaceae archaeon]